jgi:hypothetical protein
VPDGKGERRVGQRLTRFRSPAKTAPTIAKHPPRGSRSMTAANSGHREEAVRQTSPIRRDSALGVQNWAVLWFLTLNVFDVCGI